MIKAILYSDVYRPMAYSLISVLMVYSMWKEKAKIKIFFYVVYMLYAIGFFAVFSVFVTLANEEFVPEAFLWGIERIGFYFAIVVIQHFVYKIDDIGKNMDLLIINAVIVLISSYIGMKYIFIV